MNEPTSTAIVLAADGTFRQCSKCRLYKPLREFHCRANRPSGRRSECRFCHGILQAITYQASAIAQQRLARAQMLLDDAASALKRCASPDHDGPNPLPVELFSLHDPETGHLNSYCKICAIVKADRWYREHLERAKNSRSAYRQANLEQSRERDRAYLQAHGDGINRRRRDSYREDASISTVQQLNFRQRTRQAVFDHYGWHCACCGSTERLEIDHVNGGGTEHRRKERLPSGLAFYRWLIRNNFPDGYQALCRSCNASKRSGTHCRLNHAAAS
jgi:hypothetical protein